jgi:uncharacterized protein YcgI (DUF1989 family)
MGATMKVREEMRVAARRGKALTLHAGQTVRVTNSFGQQVVDTWAFAAGDLGEHMSMEHTRAALQRLRPRVGDRLVTNRRRPILALAADTSPGVHDTLIAACDRYRYQQLGCTEYHDNCTDNLAAALDELGLKAPLTPAPLNLFMNIPAAADGGLAFDPPVSRPGDYVDLLAVIDCVTAFSACPQDILPINGTALQPTAFDLAILEA